MMPSLLELAKRYGTDKAEHGYCPFYERHLDPVSPFTLIEIGIAGGASLKMWRDWFAAAKVVGVDINPSAMLDEPGITTLIGDATDPAFWEAHPAPNDLWVVVDDGSHGANDIVRAWDLLWEKVRPSGWYVIEDLATQYNVAWDGGEDGSVATRLIDGMLKRAQRGHGVSEFHCYREIVFIRKAAA